MFIYIDVSTVFHFYVIIIIIYFIKKKLANIMGDTYAALYKSTCQFLKTSNCKQTSNVLTCDVYASGKTGDSFKIQREAIS